MFNKTSAAFNILRVGIAITFLWISVLIFKEPESWGRLIQPWTLNFVSIPLKTAMIETAILDLIIGFFLLIEKYTYIFSILAALHLLVVLIVVGINAATVRDLGLLAGSIALIFDSWPKFNRSYQNGQ